MRSKRWIHCEDGSRLYIGPFWMGTPKQIEDTQSAINEEIAFYEDTDKQDDFEWLDDEYMCEMLDD